MPCDWDFSFIIFLLFVFFFCHFKSANKKPTCNKSFDNELQVGVLENNFTTYQITVHYLNVNKLRPGVRYYRNDSISRIFQRYHLFR